MTPAARDYLRFGATAAVLTAATAALGIPATRHYAGTGSASDGAVVVGCLLALAASLASAVPLAFGHGPMATRALAATGLRLAVVLIPGLALALGGWFPVKPLLFWAALSYLILLAVDTRFALARAHGEMRPATTKEDATR